MSTQITTALAIAAALVAPATQAAVFWEPSPYLSSADVPAGFYAGGSPSFLDTLEDGSLGGQLTASTGIVIGPGQFDGARDSVDADDGVINGSGLLGHSFFSSNGPAGITFTFNGAQLPSAFALVVTDGAGSVIFSAKDGNGNSLGSITRSGFFDGNHGGGTAEDRFLGVQSASGIRSITIQLNGSSGIEVDHLQYGAMPAVPEPSVWLMLAAGLGLLKLRSARRE